MQRSATCAAVMLVIAGRQTIKRRFHIDVDPSRFMEQRMSLATLAVKDLEQATAFYRHLGWVPSFGNEEVTFFQLNGVVLSLFRRDRFAQELGVKEETLGPGGTALAYNVREKKEVDEIMTRVSGSNGRVIVAPREAEWGGYSGYFADPDGHRWEVAWNPAWPIDGAGDVSIPQE